MTDTRTDRWTDRGIPINMLSKADVQ